MTYPIRAVSRMTGVSIDTLRAWERRYAAVTPVRDDRGRVYTDADVRRIALLREAVEHGHAIGRVAAMDNGQLARLAADAALAPHPARERRASLVVDTAAIISALEHFDAATLETELSRAAALLRAPELLRQVLVPVLTEVGDRWHDGRGRVAHEHMLSASVRNVLGSLLRVHQRAGVADALLFATPSGERHEFGTLGAALLAASGGLGTIYLGPDMPADDIIAVTSVMKLDVVVLGVTDLGDARRAEKEVVQVAHRLDTRIELWLGGRGAERLARKMKGRALALPDYEALEHQLTRLGARF
ncbi:MAG TPA: MerR family transcriptional regulator [Vicinamibacterales bacterium]|nr:MerR family transcriptional regulator [Vicinamibacterales bacterium]